MGGGASAAASYRAAEGVGGAGHPSTCHKYKNDKYRREGKGRHCWLGTVATKFIIPLE